MALLFTDESGPTQLLDERGIRSAADWAPELDATLAELYRSMAMTRGLDDELIALQRQGELALYPSCRGQEAAQIGAAAALAHGDWMLPQYRELGAFLMRGVAAADVGRAWRGSWHAGIGFIEHNVAPICVPIGTHALHAVGAAMASRYLDDDAVTVVFLGDGATSTGDVHEAMNLASLEAAPVVFFVQNNGWAISTPTERQVAGARIADRGAGYGMDAERVDGNDVTAVYTVVSAAIERARSGGGPTLVEAVTYRMGAHTTADDPTRYRPGEELERWAGRDPLARVRTYLESVQRWSEDDQLALDDAISARRLELREAVFGAPDLDPLDIFDVVFADPTPALLQQRADFVAELGARLGGG